MLSHEIACDIVQDRCSDQPGRCREFRPDGAHQAGAIVPLVNCQTPPGSEAAGEERSNAAGFAADDRIAKPRLDLSQ
jgi:hypothetical protein